jgi:hypothetical protein
LALARISHSHSGLAPYFTKTIAPDIR